MPSCSKSVFPTTKLATSKEQNVMCKRNFSFQILENVFDKVGNPDHVSCSKWPSNLHTMRRKEKRIEQPRKRKSAKKWVKIRLRLASTVVTSLKKNLSQKIYGGSLFWLLQVESCYLSLEVKRLVLDKTSRNLKTR